MASGLTSTSGTPADDTFPDRRREDADQASTSERPEVDHWQSGLLTTHTGPETVAILMVCVFGVSSALQAVLALAAVTVLSLTLKVTATMVLLSRVPINVAMNTFASLQHVSVLILGFGLRIKQLLPAPPASMCLRITIQLCLAVKYAVMMRLRRTSFIPDRILPSWTLVSFLSYKPLLQKKQSNQLAEGWSPAESNTADLTATHATAGDDLSVAAALENKYTDAAKLDRQSHRLEIGTYTANQHSESSTSASERASEREVAQQPRDGEQFADLVRDVRKLKLPGLDHFMLPDTFEELAEAGKQGPVVILVASAAACVAVIISTTGQPTTFTLSISQTRLKELNSFLRTSNNSHRTAFADEDISARLKLQVASVCCPDLRAALDHDVLGELWDTVAKPVLSALKLQQSTGKNRPRLWWCPTGEFTYLPIHAAGTYGDASDCCSDYVVSSYTPTLEALINARREHQPVARAHARTLLVAVPVPCRFQPLPFTVDEIKQVEKIVPPHLLIPLDAEDDALHDINAGARVQTMLDKLPDAAILHLASHGYQNTTSLLDSGFVMRDDILTVAKLMPLPLPHAFFAFLSACETAKCDQTQPDQTVHLAATLLFAGFKSIVGTMWSMQDADGPAVAKEIYERLFEEDTAYLRHDDIPYALDDAVRNLRQRGVHSSRWATYIHLGI